MYRWRPNGRQIHHTPASFPLRGADSRVRPQTSVRSQHDFQQIVQLLQNLAQGELTKRFQISCTIRILVYAYCKTTGYFSALIQLMFD